MSIDAANMFIKISVPQRFLFLSFSFFLFVLSFGSDVDIQSGFSEERGEIGLEI